MRLSFTLLLACFFGISLLFSQTSATLRWQEDLDYLVRYFPANDRSLAPTSAFIFTEKGAELHYLQAASKLDKFYEKADRLRQDIPRLTDNEIIVRMAQLVALGNNAHSRVYLLRNRTQLSSLAIRTYWFADGLYVIRALPQKEKALGCKILSINGQSVETLVDKVDALYGGNPSWKKYKRIYYLNSPEILKGLEIVEETAPVVMRLKTQEGKEFEMEIPSLPLEKSKTPREVNLDLSPLHQSADREWLTILPKKKEALPLFLRNPEKAYWYTFSEKNKELYFQHNRVEDEDSNPFVDFSEKMIQELREFRPEKMIIDLRFNTGGDLTITLPFWYQLKKQLPGKTKVVVLTSYSTFSAAISNVVQYRRLLDANLVGEPVGDYLTNWSEGGRFYLPHSGIEVKYANGFHDMTFFPDPVMKKLLEDATFRLRYEQKILEPKELVLDKKVELRFEDYIKGKDPLLDY